jgi:hypothetical protein
MLNIYIEPGTVYEMYARMINTDVHDQMNSKMTFTCNNMQNGQDMTIPAPERWHNIKLGSPCRTICGTRSESYPF